jgi:hypothetical protein
MEKGWYRVTNISRSDSPAVVIKTTFEGQGDPGYINTCCERLLSSSHSDSKLLLGRLLSPTFMLHLIYLFRPS